MTSVTLNNLRLDKSVPYDLKYSDYYFLNNDKCAFVLGCASLLIPDKVLRIALTIGSNWNFSYKKMNQLTLFATVVYVDQVRALFSAGGMMSAMTTLSDTKFTVGQQVTMHIEFLI